MRNILKKYRNLRPLSLAALSILGAGSGAALFFLLPWVLSLFVAPPSADYALQTASTRPLSYGESPLDPCHPTQVGRDARYKLDFHRKIKVSESPRLVFRIELNRDLLAMCISSSGSLNPIKASAELRSSAFNIQPQSKVLKVSESAAEWVWTVTPKSAGKHALQLAVEGSDVFEPNLSRLQSVLNIGQQSQYEIGIDVDVRTELGLTPTQDALFKLVGAIVGLLGTILGFPFLKVAFESKKRRPASRRGKV